MVERLQLLDALAVGAVGCGEQPVPPLELGHVDVVHVGRVVRQPLDGALAPHRRRTLRLVRAGVRVRVRGQGQGQG